MQCTRVPRRRVASLVSAIVIAAAIPAGADVVVGRDARTAVALTVYSGQDLAIVRESRSMDLPEGDGTVRFEDVAARLDPRTVTLLSTDESAYEVTLRNQKTAAITVTVRDRIDGTWQVLDSSLPARKEDAQTVAFDVPVPVGGETVLRYRVRVGG